MTPQPLSTADHPRQAGGTQPPVATNDWKGAFGLREMGVYYALILLVAILAILTTAMGKPSYLSMENLTNVMFQTSLVGIMAVAMTVILISGNFDLSVASVGALSGFILLGNADALGFWPAFALAILVAMALGLMNGAIVEYLGINSFIVTLGSMTAIRGLVLLYTDGRSMFAASDPVVDWMKAFEGGKQDVFLPVLLAGVGLLVASFFMAIVGRHRSHGQAPQVLGLGVGGLALTALAGSNWGSLVMPNSILYMALFTGLVWFILNFTITGRRHYAVGANPEAARLSGINVRRYKLMAFVICSGAAGFAGVLFACRLRSLNPVAMEGSELTVIAAAILGGTSLFGGAGSVVKSLAGAFLLYSLTNGFNILNLGANWQGLIEGAVVVGAAAIYTVGNKRLKSKTG